MFSQRLYYGGLCNFVTTFSIKSDCCLEVSRQPLGFIRTYTLDTTLSAQICTMLIQIHLGTLWNSLLVCTQWHQHRAVRLALTLALLHSSKRKIIEAQKRFRGNKKFLNTALLLTLKQHTCGCISSSFLKGVFSHKCRITCLPLWDMLQNGRTCRTWCEEQ